MAFLRILLIFLIIVFVIRLIARPLLRYLLRNIEKKANNHVKSDTTRPEGDVRIEDAGNNDQDFSDYEEIK